MKTLSEQLSNYASYHRDSRNIATHFVGIPMIVLAVLVLTSRPVLDISVFSLSPAIVLVVLSCCYYLRLDWFFGVVMTVILFATAWLAASVALYETSLWLSWGVGLFVVGWVFQFIGHIYEGKKPAFVDDIMGLAIGPLFVVAELVFMLGFKASLRQQIERDSSASNVN